MLLPVLALPLIFQDFLTLATTSDSADSCHPSPVSNPNLEIFHSCEDPATPLRPRWLDCISAVLNLPTSNATMPFHTGPPFDGGSLPWGVSCGGCNVSYALTESTEGEEGAADEEGAVNEEAKSDEKGASPTHSSPAQDEAKEGETETVRWTWDAMRAVARDFLLLCERVSPEGRATTGGYAFLGPGCRFRLVVTGSGIEGGMNEGEGGVFVERGDGKGWARIGTPVRVGGEDGERERKGFWSD